MRNIFLFLLLFIFGCETKVKPLETTTKSDTLIEVSMVALLANPDAYHGKHIRVVAAINLDFESNMLCLHSEDVLKGIDKNCIWTNFEENTLKKSQVDFSRLENNYVIAEGIFDGPDKTSRTSGALTHISRLDVYNSF